MMNQNQAPFDGFEKLTPLSKKAASGQFFPSPTNRGPGLSPSSARDQPPLFWNTAAAAAAAGEGEDNDRAAASVSRHQELERLAGLAAVDTNLRERVQRTARTSRPVFTEHVVKVSSRRGRGRAATAAEGVLAPGPGGGKAAAGGGGGSGPGSPTDQHSRSFLSPMAAAAAKSGEEEEEKEGAAGPDTAQRRRRRLIWGGAAGGGGGEISTTADEKDQNDNQLTTSSQKKTNPLLSRSTGSLRLMDVDNNENKGMQRSARSLSPIQSTGLGKIDAFESRSLSPIQSTGLGKMDAFEQHPPKRTTRLRTNTGGDQRRRTTTGGDSSTRSRQTTSEGVGEKDYLPTISKSMPIMAEPRLQPLHSKLRASHEGPLGGAEEKKEAGRRRPPRRAPTPRLATATPRPAAEQGRRRRRGPSGGSGAGAGDAPPVDLRGDVLAAFGATFSSPGSPPPADAAVVATPRPARGGPPPSGLLPGGVGGGGAAAAGDRLEELALEAAPSFLGGRAPGRAAAAAAAAAAALGGSGNRAWSPGGLRELGAFQEEEEEDDDGVQEQDEEQQQEPALRREDRDLDPSLGTTHTEEEEGCEETTGGEEETGEGALAVVGVMLAGQRPVKAFLYPGQTPLEAAYLFTLRYKLQKDEEYGEYIRSLTSAFEIKKRQVEERLDEIDRQRRLEDARDAEEKRCLEDARDAEEKIQKQVKKLEKARRKRSIHKLRVRLGGELWPVPDLPGAAPEEVAAAFLDLHGLQDHQNKNTFFKAITMYVQKFNEMNHASSGKS